MTAHEMEELSKLIADKVLKHPAQCLAFDRETIEELRGFAKFLKQGKRTAWITLVGLGVTAVIGFIVAGVVVKFKSAIGL
jgi:hypothetical protein